MSMKWYHWVIIGVLFVLCWTGGLLCGQKWPEKGDSSTTDKSIIYDTLTYYSPIPVAGRDTGLKVPVLPDMVMLPGVTDTLYLPREEKTYQDSTYKAVVSGYQPSLDFIEVYPRTEIITETRTVQVKKKPRLALGIQAGGGVTMANGQVICRPYVGIGVTWCLFSW